MRSEERYKVRIDGRLLLPNGDIRDCTVVDLSTNGACVETRYFVDMPETVELYESHSGHTFSCSVRWQMGKRVGLQFVDASTRRHRRELLASVR